MDYCKNCRYEIFKENHPCNYCTDGLCKKPIDINLKSLEAENAYLMETLTTALQEKEAIRICLKRYVEKYGDSLM